MELDNIIEHVHFESDIAESTMQSSMDQLFGDKMNPFGEHGTHKMEYKYIEGLTEYEHKIKDHWKVGNFTRGNQMTKESVYKEIDYNVKQEKFAEYFVVRKYNQNRFGMKSSKPTEIEPNQLVVVRFLIEQISLIDLSKSNKGANGEIAGVWTANHVDHFKGKDWKVKQAHVVVHQNKGNNSCEWIKEEFIIWVGIVNDVSLDWDH